MAAEWLHRTWTRRGVLVLGLAGVAVAALGSTERIVGILPAVLAGGALIAQHSLGAGPAVVEFEEDDWDRGDGVWIFEIPQSRHGRRSPTASVWRLQPDGAMARIYLEPRVTPDGCVRLVHTGDHPFDGEVRIN